MAYETEELLEQLMDCKDISVFINRYEDYFKIPQLGDILQGLIAVSPKKKAKIVKETGLNKAYAYEILRNEKVPTRDKVLRFILSVEMSLSDAQRVVKLAGHSPLYPKDKRDAILVYAIMNRLNVVKTNILLEKNNFGII